MLNSDYIAIDWGTTNRRIYVMSEGGAVIDTFRDGMGVLSVAKADFAAEFEAIRCRFGKLPIIAAGMVGSNRGALEVPYRAAPTGLKDLAAGAISAFDKVYIVPGISYIAPGVADVMRGEEIQVLGALSASLAQSDALFCQPGTHNKWIEVKGGKITAFATAMTGELFSLIESHSILSAMMERKVVSGTAFTDGLERGAGCCDLSTALFQARAAVLLHQRALEDTASYVSGLLIGADVGARKDLDAREVVVLSSGGLAELYEVALRWAGANVRAIDSHAAFAAGIHAIKLELG